MKKTVITLENSSLQDLTHVIVKNLENLNLEHISHSSYQGVTGSSYSCILIGTKKELTIEK